MLLKYITARVDLNSFVVLAILGLIGWAVVFQRTDRLGQCYRAAMAEYGDQGGQTVSSKYFSRLPAEVVERACSMKLILYSKDLAHSTLVTALDIAVSEDDQDGKSMLAFYRYRMYHCRRGEPDSMGRSMCTDLGD